MGPLGGEPRECCMAPSLRAKGGNCIIFRGGGKDRVEASERCHRDGVKGKLM